MIDVETLFGTSGKELEEKMMLALNNSTRVTYLSRFLEKRLLKSTCNESSIFSSIKYVIHSKTNTPVAQLSDKFNLSRRQFERKFKEYSGFSPGLFSRIIRFGSATKEYGQQNKTLTQIALECGYYDQSHFIHEFKTFSGYHPKEYFKGRPEGIEYRDG
jgi:AraC-like DNA-binding protein